MDDDREILKKGTMEYELFNYILDWRDTIEKEIDTLNKLRHILNATEYHNKYKLLNKQLDRVNELIHIKLMNPKEGCNGFMLEE